VGASWRFVTALEYRFSSQQVPSERSHFFRAQSNSSGHARFFRAQSLCTPGQTCLLNSPGQELVFVSIAGCAACWRRRCDLSRTTTFSHHGRHLQALPAVFARTSEATSRRLVSAVWQCPMAPRINEQIPLEMSDSCIGCFNVAIQRHECSPWRQSLVMFRGSSGLGTWVPPRTWLIG
jgi:hypothetical protein